MQRAEWELVASALGQADLKDLMLIAALEDEDIVAARRELTPVRRGAANLLIGAVKAKLGITTKLLPQAVATAAAAQAQPTEPLPTTATNTVPAALTNATSGVSQGSMGTRVNLGTILNQALNQEVPMLAEAELAEIRAVYIKVAGDEPIEQADPSDSQLTTLKFALGRRQPLRGLSGVRSA